MVQGYFYLISSLPGISYGKEAPITSEEFKSLCAQHLGSIDYSFLKYCTLDVTPIVMAEKKLPRTVYPFINNWVEREWALRVHLARLRSSKTGWQLPEETQLLYAPNINDAAAALALESPLEGELLLDKGRWAAIEDSCGLEYFHINTIYAYLLKLLLIERRQKFNTEEGFAEYKAIYAGILENAPKAGQTENRI